MNKEKEILKKIKERGFIKIIMRPTTFQESAIDLEKCKSMIEKSIVLLRGWDYPHWPQNPEFDKLYFGQDFIGAYVDWRDHKEVWRFYQSGQFVHYLAIFEDWLAEDSWGDGRSKKIPPKSILDITSSIYSLTEIFEFFFRLSKYDYYNNGLNVEISLHELEGRKLQIIAPGRMPLIREYVCAVNIYKYEKDFSSEEMIDRNKFALEIIKELFLRFGWQNQPLGIFESDQQKLIQKRQ